MRKNHNRHSIKLGILAGAIIAAPYLANAAGLGKLTVLSPLGKPLRAELDVSATPDELGSLTARVAPVEAFRQANIDFVPTLSSLRFSLDKRLNGQPYFKITSDRAINDPFLDFLVELNWSAGRLVREYTFLLDPAEMAVSQESEVNPTVAPEINSEPMLQSAAKSIPAPTAGAGLSSRPADVVKATEDDSGASGHLSRLVRRGDNLTRIASELLPEGVSLEQMLVALFKSNPAAFDGDNMNRLRAGKILTVPSISDAASTDAGEARRIIVAQSADFAAYRRELAAMQVAKAGGLDVSAQESSGLVSPRVEENGLPKSLGQDRLQVSRTEAEKRNTPGVSSKNAEEDVTARDKALKEANSRIAELEKNLTDLKRLAELKSQTGDGIQGSQLETASGTASTTQSGKARFPQTHTAPATTRAEKDATKDAHKQAEVREPGFIEENLLYLLGGGGILAALAGFFGFRALKRKRSEASWGAPSALSHGVAAAESSVFSVSSGQRVDTGSGIEPSEHAHEDSQGEADNVDPLQEAEVYLAYGRDGQAEEILLDALKTTPNRLEIHGKLLEIYAARHSVPQFLTLAQDVHAQTSGQGAEWEHALSLGRVLDPTHPLFGGTPPATALPPSATIEESTAVGSPSSAQESAPLIDAIPESLDFDLDLSASDVSAVEESRVRPEGTAVPTVESSVTLDFDLDLGKQVAEPVAENPAEAPIEADTSVLDFDLDLAASTPDSGKPDAAVEAASSQDSGNLLDFDLGEPAVTPVVEAAESAADQPLDFDFDLGEPETKTPEPALGLSSINLDLDQPLPDSESSISADNPEVATKLELAQAYQEMGDKEGARELLQEVLREGSSTQQEQARSKLEALG